MSLLYREDYDKRRSNKIVDDELKKMNFVITKICLDDYREIWNVKKHLVYDIDKLKKRLLNKYMYYEIIFKTTFKEINFISLYDNEKYYNKRKFYLM